MPKRLIIAEKPSVARDIASALKIPANGHGCFESPEFVVSSAVGHLLEMILPPELDHAKKRWALNDLPLLPARFELAPVDDSNSQLKLLLGLLKRADVTGVINACDAGREGELIFHNIMRYAECRKPVDQEFNAALPAVDAAERPPVQEAKAIGEKTKPPQRYTEASILSAMESAGRGIEDEELKDAMAGRGLGTPATRAAILEGLIRSEYLVRKKRELHPTDKAFALLTRLKSLALDSLCSPQLTGEWEFKLHQIERGKFQRTVFMQEIHADVSSLVAKVKQTAPKVEASPDLCCPTCKKPLQIRPDAYCCPDRHVYLNKQIAQRLMTIEEFKTLTSTGSVGPLEGFISKLGKPFAAKLIINEKGFPAFDFPPKEVPTKTLTIGQWKVSEGELFYAVEKKNLKFNIRRQIAQRPISENELEELLVNSKTPLLSNFISKAGRPFSAYLVLKNGGSVEFEFEPRPQNGALAGAR